MDQSGSNFGAFLSSLGHKYDEAVKLIESNANTPQEPYKSKYEASNILTQDIKLQLDQLRTLAPADDSVTWLPNNSRVDIIEALVNFELSRVSYYTEEITQADKYIKEAKESLVRSNLQLSDVRVSLISINVLNQIGLIKTYFEEYEESMNCLKLAERVYNDFTSSETRDLLRRSKEFISHLSHLFKLDHCNCDDDLSDLTKSVESLYTSTVYFIAQIHEKTHSPDEAAKYCVLTLQRQYSSLESFDTIDWAINAATLAQYYFLTLKNFTTARHMIAASMLLMSNLKAYDDSDHYAKSVTDIERIVVKYCLCLLEKGTNSVTPSEGQNERLQVREVPGELIDRLIEPSDALSAIEDTIPVQVPNSFESARKIFLLGQSKIKSAIKYLTLNEHASNHAECIGDYSQLFRLLAPYELDTSRIFAMGKKRIKLLEELLKEMNPRYFLSFHRKYSFELAEIYQELALFKLKEYRSKEQDIRTSLRPGQSVPKTLVDDAVLVNQLIDGSIKWYTKFRNSYKDRKSNKLPAKYDDEIVRPLIVATFSIAKLISNKVTYDLTNQINFLNTAETYYDEVISYYDLNEGHRSLIETEVNVIRELLPLVKQRKQGLATSTMY